MRILAYCCVNQSRRFQQAEESIRALEGITQLVFDYEDDASKPWYVNVLEKYQRARGMCLAGGYSHLLTCESDMLVPSDAALKLAALNAPVAYGLYCLRHGSPLWNAFIALDEQAGFSLSDVIVRENAPDEWAKANAGEPFEIYGAGFGTTLIQRSVLEQFEFRNYADEDSFYVDWLFAVDCKRRGIKQMCEPSVTCGHITDSTTVLYPDLAQETLCRVEYLTR